MIGKCVSYTNDDTPERLLSASSKAGTFTGPGPAMTMHFGKPSVNFLDTPCSSPLLYRTTSAAVQSAILQRSITFDIQPPPLDRSKTPDATNLMKRGSSFSAHPNTAAVSVAGRATVRTAGGRVQITASQSSDTNTILPSTPLDTRLEKGQAHATLTDSRNAELRCRAINSHGQTPTLEGQALGCMVPPFVTVRPNSRGANDTHVTSSAGSNAVSAPPSHGYQKVSIQKVPSPAVKAAPGPTANTNPIASTHALAVDGPSDLTDLRLKKGSRGSVPKVVTKTPPEKALNVPGDVPPLEQRKLPRCSFDETSLPIDLNPLEDIDPGWFEQVAACESDDGEDDEAELDETGTDASESSDGCDNLKSDATEAMPRGTSAAQELLKSLLSTTTATGITTGTWHNGSSATATCQDERFNTPAILTVSNNSCKKKPSTTSTRRSSGFPNGSKHENSAYFNMPQSEQLHIKSKSVGSIHRTIVVNDAEPQPTGGDHLIPLPDFKIEPFTRTGLGKTHASKHTGTSLAESVLKRAIARQEQDQFKADEPYINQRSPKQRNDPSDDDIEINSGGDGYGLNSSSDCSILSCCFCGCRFYETRCLSAEKQLEAHLRDCDASPARGCRFCAMRIIDVGPVSDLRLARKKHEMVCRSNPENTVACPFCHIQFISTITSSAYGAGGRPVIAPAKALCRVHLQFSCKRNPEHCCQFCELRFPNKISLSHHLTRCSAAANAAGVPVIPLWCGPEGMYSEGHTKAGLWAGADVLTPEEYAAECLSQYNPNTQLSAYVSTFLGGISEYDLEMINCGGSAFTFAAELAAADAVFSAGTVPAANDIYASLDASLRSAAGHDAHLFGPDEGYADEIRGQNERFFFGEEAAYKYSEKGPAEHRRSREKAWASPSTSFKSQNSRGGSPVMGQDGRQQSSCANRIDSIVLAEIKIIDAQLAVCGQNHDAKRNLLKKLLLRWHPDKGGARAAEISTPVFEYVKTLWKRTSRRNGS